MIPIMLTDRRPRPQLGAGFVSRILRNHIYAGLKRERAGRGRSAPRASKRGRSDGLCRAQLDADAR